MLSHKALAARLRLLRKMGVTEHQDGDFRVVLGAPQGEEYVVVGPSPEIRAAMIQAARQLDEFDPTNAADLVLQTQKIDQDN